ncbi:MAG: hypothetical protein HQM09_12120 [Candidatus Riflebacteria bacterium]|nr:hypothetical protein [Candidatus Riflebacteria bacterium]
MMHWNDTLISWMGAFVLLTGFMTVVFRRFGNVLGCYRLQSIGFALATAAVGLDLGEPHLYALAVLSGVIKGYLVPNWIGGFARRLGSRAEEKMAVSPAVSLFIAGGLLLAAHIISRTAVGSASAKVDDLMIALALLLIGFFFMVSRSHVLSHMMGILFMENAVTGAVVMLSSGLPLIVDLGILFDVLVGILVMSILVFRIQGAFDSVDTSELTTLHG